jgi:hypothetical protein
LTVKEMADPGATLPEGWDAEEEAAILEKLPLVCGKLLALTAWNMSESPRVAPTPSSRGVPPTPSSRGAVTPAVPFGPLG